MAVWTAVEGTADCTRGRFSSPAGTIGSCLHVSAFVTWGDAVLAASCCGMASARARGGVSHLLASLPAWHGVTRRANRFVCQLKSSCAIRLMGVTGLWRVLTDADIRPRSHSASTGGLGSLVDELNGAVVALDLGLLVCQALTQDATKELFSDEGRVTKLGLERCTNLLRFGVTPVGVADGKPPAEKFEKFARRSGWSAGPHTCVTVDCLQGHTRAAERPNTCFTTLLG